MTRLLRRVPWYASAPALLAVAAALALALNLLLGDYFTRSFLDEADPLANAGPPPAAAEEPAPVAEDPGSGGSPMQPEPPTGVLAEGEWRDGEPGHNGEGLAKLIRTAEGRLVLRVEEFSVTNGPDLFIVLSPDEDGYADGSLNLGRLRATDGNINYEIPDGTDVARFKSAVVWCRSFDVTFAVATLDGLAVM
jgi:hypothetical protein